MLRRKLRQDWPTIEAAVETVRSFFNEIVPLTASTHAAALPLARDHGFSFFDALIIASALETDCDTLYSEDLQDGRVIAAW